MSRIDNNAVFDSSAEASNFYSFLAVAEQTPSLCASYVDADYVGKLLMCAAKAGYGQYSVRNNGTFSVTLPYTGAPLSGVCAVEISGRWALGPGCSSDNLQCRILAEGNVEVARVPVCIAMDDPVTDYLMFEGFVVQALSVLAECGQIQFDRAVAVEIVNRLWNASDPPVFYTPHYLRHVEIDLYTDVPEEQIIGAEAHSEQEMIADKVMGWLGSLATALVRSLADATHGLFLQYHENALREAIDETRNGGMPKRYCVVLGADIWTRRENRSEAKELGPLFGFSRNTWSILCSMAKVDDRAV